MAKTVWQLIYKTDPKGSSKAKKFRTFADAKKAAKEWISQIGISSYTDALREGGPHKNYRAAMADFLENYVNGNDFWHASLSLPSCEAEDYEWGSVPDRNDAYEPIDEDVWYDDGEDELADFGINIEKNRLSFEYRSEECAHLETDMVVMGDEDKVYRFDFSADRAFKSKFKYLHLIVSPLRYGTASYPLLILKVLESSAQPLDQQEIISRIEADYHTVIERKAIGRNIALLKELRYNVVRHGGGYCIPKKSPVLEGTDKQAVIDSIRANEALSDVYKQALTDKLSDL